MASSLSIPRLRLLAAAAALLAATAVLGAPAPAQASYRSGNFAGRTSQGYAISFIVSRGRVASLETKIVDSCGRGAGAVRVNLHPRSTAIARNGNWYRRAAAVPSQPTVYRGHLSGSTGTGSIDDVSFFQGRRCHGRVSYRVSRVRRLPQSVVINSATTSPPGLVVVVTVTSTNSRNGLLVYATNRRCAGSYAAARALIQAEGNRGFVSDLLVSANIGSAVRGSYQVSSNTFRAGSYTTACALLYDGNGGRAPNPVAGTDARTIT